MIELPTGWVQYEADIIKACGGEGNIRQVKEKFGRLTCYLGNEEYDRVKLDELERKCILTCMSCGSREKIYKKCFGWIGPVCEDCIKQPK